MNIVWLHRSILYRKFTSNLGYENARICEHPTSIKYLQGCFLLLFWKIFLLNIFYKCYKNVVIDDGRTSCMTTHDIIFTHIYIYLYICIIRYAFLWKYTLHATFLWPYTFVIFCTFLRQENLEVRTKESWKHIFLILKLIIC